MQVKTLIVFLGLILLNVSTLTTSLVSLTPSLTYADELSPLPTAGMFVENRGQFDPQVRFQTLVGDDWLWITDEAIWFTKIAPQTPTPQLAENLTPVQSSRQGVHLKLSFVDANRNPKIVPLQQHATRFHYLRSSEPAEQQIDVPVWAGVRYIDLYPGIDLIVSQPAYNEWAWHLVANPTADLSMVRLRVAGGEIETLTAQGVRLSTTLGPVDIPLLTVPATHQFSPRLLLSTETNTGQIATPFADGPPTHSESKTRQNHAPTSPADALLLDYGTYLGGYFTDFAANIAADDNGNAYLVGTTSSPDFPTTPGAPGQFFYGGSSDAFVAKLNDDGSNILFATFLGGVGDDWGDDWGYGVALDGANNIYLTGWTTSRKFPVTPNAYDQTYNGGFYDVFAAKLNPTGNAIVYATYLGGDDQEKGTDIAVDSDGHAYVGGWTASFDFPTAAADDKYDSFQGGLTDAFVTKLNVDGSALDYSLFIGGSDLELGLGVAVDKSGYACLTGGTESDDFPWRLAVDYDLGGDEDAFVSCVRPTGGNLFYSTYLGGSEIDLGREIVIDDDGRAYVIGATNSSDFPVTGGAFSTVYNGGYSDAFVAKLRAGTLYYATFLGTTDSEEGYGIAVDESGAAYVTGQLADDMLVKLSPDGSAVDARFSVVGSSSCQGNDVFVDSQGGVYFPVEAKCALPTTEGVFDTDADNIWIGKLGAATSVSGRVTDYDGQPLAGIDVAAGQLFTTTTDAAGDYTLNIPAGSRVIAPTTAGYFWSPNSRRVSTPPDVSGIDFVGTGVTKSVTPGSAKVANYGQILTYTVQLVAPQTQMIHFYDTIPTHTRFVSGSLSAPPQITHNDNDNTLSGAITLTQQMPVTITFGAQVMVTGTDTFAPQIINRACIYQSDETLNDCEWSNQTTNYTVLWSIYLPLILR